MNGVTIDRVDLAEGWVVFRAGNPPPPAEELPHFLQKTFQGWLQRNRDLRVKTVLPIVAGGNTVAIYVWFD